MRGLQGPSRRGTAGWSEEQIQERRAKVLAEVLGGGIERPAPAPARTVAPSPEPELDPGPEP